MLHPGYSNITPCDCLIFFGQQKIEILILARSILRWISKNYQIFEKNLKLNKENVI